ncbi:MAG: PD-(D/E)XK motif protein [Magnetococcales bacterium]|nr:PD-(D/E)XK motif protein [Magnetococcales bacterium]
MTIIGDAWRSIGASTCSSSGWDARRVYPASACDIFAALGQPGAIPGLLVELESRTVPTSIRFPRSVGFTVHPETVIPGPNGKVRLCLVLADNRYGDVFEVLVEDVAGAVGEASSDAEGLRVFVARLNIWQAFMQKHGPDGLGPDEQAGLFAELVLLEKLAGNLPAGNVTGSWKGPLGGIHDFDFGGRCLEVKSSSTPSRPGFTVSSLVQLDETRVGLLLLCHAMLDIGSGENGDTLPELVERIRNRVGGEDVAALARLDGLLIQAGYLDTHASLYASRRFMVVCLRWFRVAGGFPRIRPSDARPGIVSASYQVSIDACASFATEEQEAVHLLLGTDHG